MIIDKLRVKNYKSLEDVEVPLRPLTVFVGPNNSGKSNIQDAFRFLKELAFVGSQAVLGRGGLQDVVWGGDLKRPVEIELEGQIRDAQLDQRPFKYQVGIKATPWGYGINKETFILRVDDSERTLLESSEQFGFRTTNEQEPDQETGRWGQENRLGIFRLQGSLDLRHYTAASFASAVAEWFFYRLAPSRMGTPGPARKEKYLLEEGDNLATILLSIQSEDRTAFSELEGYLHAAIPEVEELSVGLTEDNRAYFRWRESGLPSDFRVKSWLSSEGTRQILGLLALRFAPSLPPLICIEDPDNFIHPGLTELVADLLKSISSRAQVLVNTHSPYLLNQLLPEDLLIVEKKEGKTQVRPLSDQEGIKDAVQILGLGELWYSGHIGGVP
ncbi:MAG: AAA family ATPase [Dehalococcoidia bacterium]|nr:AAA family ATPase [Dehalococcoidia bacterium]